ncbi:MAG: penicillin-binding transpeptidase domain-containing protein [Solirubrobacterales bacterium]
MRSKAKPTDRRRATARLLPFAAVALIAFVGGAMVADGGEEEAALARFAEAWAAGDRDAMYAQLTPESVAQNPPKDFEDAYRQAERTATIESIEVGEARGPIEQGSGEALAVPVEIETRSFGTIEGELAVPVDDGAVAWRPELVFPGLQPGERLDRRLSPPQRGTISARDGTELVSGPVEARTVNPIAAVIAGEIGSAPAERARQMSAQGFPKGTPAGTSGLELAFDGYLAGTPGGRLIARSESGDEARILARGKPTKAKPLRTTIDPDLQAAAVTALGETFGGTAVLDATTGQVMALSGIAFSAPQPPGSTFKIITTTAALEEGVASPDTEFPVATGATVEGREIANAHDESCGGTLVTSFALSCNSVFAPLGAELGAERLLEEAEEYGFNAPPTLYSRESIAATQPPSSTIPDPIGGELDAAVSAIGQGKVLATPLQMASVAQTIANEGVRLPTSIVRSPELAPNAEPVEVTTPEIAAEVSAMMRRVVRSGTGKAAALPETSVAGKTGTAELGPKVSGSADPAADPELEVDAWFTAFAPVKRPALAVAVMVVNADGDGGVIAAPIAREILATRFG